MWRGTARFHPSARCARCSSPRSSRAPAWIQEPCTSGLPISGSTWTGCAWRRLVWSPPARGPWGGAAVRVGSWRSISTRTTSPLSIPWSRGSRAGLPSPAPGPARGVLRLEGSFDSLGLETRASVERLTWRGWRLPAGRARLAWQPGPVPMFTLEATLDSVAHGEFGLSGAFASARGTPDSLTWHARSRIGDGGAVLAGGRFARRDGPTDGRTLAIGLDSLAVRLPGDVWVLERPTELTVTDSAATVSRLALQSAYGSGKLVLEGALPTRGRADAHLQLEAFPVAGLYALLERDTAGVGGTVTVAAGLSGTRASPVSSGSFSLSNATFGEFRAPFMDGTFDYHDQRLNGALHLWRAGQQILDVQVHLPLDLALEPVARRQLPATP